MLKFNGAWRFDSPAEIGQGVIQDFYDLICRIAGQGNRKLIFEHFKSYFAGAAGLTSYFSSNLSWAESDLRDYMDKAANNAPLFIEAFYDSCNALHHRNSEIVVPDVARMNRVLSENRAGFQISPPDLVFGDLQLPISVPEKPPSLDQQAQEIIQQSLRTSERLLSEGNDRQAVQEILWLLETVSTAFRGLGVGDGTVQGKYFNKIAEDLCRFQKGTTLNQVLNWITALHGYLSSPTGGGVRHGADLGSGISVLPNEARLFCNLIRSYISYLMVEHDRLSRI
jgi:hypothetical protein